MVQVGDEHVGFKKISDQLNKVSNSGDSIDIDEFDPSVLLPSKFTLRRIKFSAAICGNLSFEFQNKEIFLHEK